jgi:hypothetical protein
MPLKPSKEKKYTRIRILKKTLKDVRKAAKRSDMSLVAFVDVNLRVASQVMVLDRVDKVGLT